MRLARLLPALAPVLAAGWLAALPVAAQEAADPAPMSDTEREALRAEIRAYLLDNPEVLLEAMSVLESREQATQAEADMALVASLRDQIQDDGVSWVGGNPEGDITVVEFMDYRCGYCRRAFQEVEDLVSSDGNVRFVLKEFPILGEQSDMASRFAIAVHQIHGDDAYKAAHDALMQIDTDVEAGSLTRLAEALGLEAQPILDRMMTAEVSEVIAANHALAQQLGINGTPTFVMGDRMVRGYVPLDAMRALLEEERAG